MTIYRQKQKEKNMMKQTANRLLALLLAMMMTLSLAACGKAPQTGITDGSVYAFRVEK
jgi:uncharacterized lipoprotein YehR (DUF1307 family)